MSKDDNANAVPAVQTAAGEDAPSGVSRRGLLHGAVIGGVGLATMSSAAGMIEASASTATGTNTGSAAEHQWAMVMDLRYCNGCKLCTTSCQTYHYLHEQQTWIKVFTMENAAGEKYYMPRPCMMCEDPACVPVCPVNANFRNDEGLTLVDQDRCVGTRICMNACPYEARYFNWKTPIPAPRQPFKREPTWPVPQVEGTVGKCVYCAAMLPAGKLPECVTYCPMGVIYLADLVSDTAVNGLGKTVKFSEFIQKNDAVKFKESYGTSPRVWYILGHDQDIDNDTAVG